MVGASLYMKRFLSYTLDRRDLIYEQIFKSIRKIFGRGNLIDLHKVNINSKVGAIRYPGQLHHFDQIFVGTAGH